MRTRIRDQQIVLTEIKGEWTAQILADKSLLTRAVQIEPLDGILVGRRTNRYIQLTCMDSDASNVIDATGLDVGDSAQIGAEPVELVDSVFHLICYKNRAHRRLQGMLW